MAKQEAQRYKLIAPDGTKVTVTGDSRRDTLLARGYKYSKSEGKYAKSEATGEKPSNRKDETSTPPAGAPTAPGE